MEDSQMETKMERLSLISACKKYMGIPGESLKEFAAGFKLLTDKDKEDLKSEFLKIGVEIIER